MAEEKKKKKEEKTALETLGEMYEKAAQSGYLGTKAKVAVEEDKKKKKKSGY